MTQKKKCTRCGKLKPLKDFYLARVLYNPKHRVARCRKCFNEIRCEALKKKYHECPEYREKQLIRSRLRSRVRYGTMKKPRACEQCGATVPKRQLHGHHHKGLTRPLDVKWLCFNCHKKAG